MLKKIIVLLLSCNLTAYDCKDELKKQDDPEENDQLVLLDRRCAKIQIKIISTMVQLRKDEEILQECRRKDEELRSMLAIAQEMRSNYLGGVMGVMRIIKLLKAIMHTPF